MEQYNNVIVLLKLFAQELYISFLILNGRSLLSIDRDDNYS